MSMFRDIQARDVVRALRFNYVWVFLALLVLVFSLIIDSFPNGENFIGIVRSVSIIGLFALGNTLVFLGAGVDVSVLALGYSTGMLFGKLFHAGVPTQAALAIVFVYSAVAGLANGILVTKVRIAPFIATLATGTVFAGITERLSGGASIFNLGEQHTPPDTFFAAIGRGTVGAVPIQILIFLGTALGAFLLLNFSLYGRYLYAAGANPRAARLNGVNVDRVLIVSYVICGLFSGMAGLIRTSDLGLATRTGATIQSQGAGLLESIGAVLIGGTALSGGVGTVQGTIGGAMVLGVITNGLFLLAAPNWARLLSNGGVVIGAVAIGSLMAGTLAMDSETIRDRVALYRNRVLVLLRLRPASL